MEKLRQFFIVFKEKQPLDFGASRKITLHELGNSLFFRVFLVLVFKDNRIKAEKNHISPKRVPDGGAADPPPR